MATRFYAPDLVLPAADYMLEGSEAHHLRTVCRCRAGDRVELFDGKGSCAQATVETVERRSVYLRLGEFTRIEPSPAGLTIACALPKGDRATVLIEKCTELGVRTLIPLKTHRSVTDPKEGKLDRLQRTVVEACKQCGRNTLMTIGPPSPWSQVCEEASGGDPRWIFHLQGEPIPRVGQADAPVVVAVGPEGGWTEDEVELARAAGWTVVSLPGHVLRVETAVIAAAALCRRPSSD